MLCHGPLVKIPFKLLSYPGGEFVLHYDKTTRVSKWFLYWPLIAREIIFFVVTHIQKTVSKCTHNNADWMYMHTQEHNV